MRDVRTAVTTPVPQEDTSDRASALTSESSLKSDQASLN